MDRIARVRNSFFALQAELNRPWMIIIVTEQLDAVVGKYVTEVWRSGLSGDQLIQLRLLPTVGMIEQFRKFETAPYGRRREAWALGALFQGLAMLSFATEEIIIDEYQETVRRIESYDGYNPNVLANRNIEPEAIPTKLLVNITDNYDSACENLRRQCFLDQASNFEDQFNEASQFLLISEVDGKLIGYLRITSNPHGPLITYTKMFGDFRNSSDTLDLSNALIDPSYRGKGLFEVLVLLALAYANSKGSKYVNCAVVKDKMKLRCNILHFDLGGESVQSYEPYGNVKTVTPMICDLERSIQQIKIDLTEYIYALRDKAITLDVHVTSLMEFTQKEDDSMFIASRTIGSEPLEADFKPEEKSSDPRLSTQLNKSSYYLQRFDDLRINCYPGQSRNHEDKFNDDSQFLYITSDQDELIGLARISMNPYGPLITQAYRKEFFRNESDTADLSNVMIEPRFRREGFFDVLVLSGLAFAYKRGCKYVNAAAFDDKLKERCSRLFFDVSDKRVQSFEPYGSPKMVTPMICDLEKSIEGISKELHVALEVLRKNGVEVKMKE